MILINQMDLHKDIIENKEEFYSLAIEYYNKIDEEYREECSISRKSIAILVDHEFIVTPCIEIKLELRSVVKQNKIGNYFLYVNQEKEFVDEFFVAL